MISGITNTDSLNYCTFNIDDTSFIVTSQLVRTFNGEQMLTSVSEIGVFTPIFCDLVRKGESNLQHKFTTIVNAFLETEYRFVTLEYETVRVSAYRSKKYEHRFRTIPFYIGGHLFSADFFQVYDDTKRRTFYRFITYDENYHIVVVDASYLNNEELVGPAFEYILKKFIKAARKSRSLTDLKDSWDFSNCL